MTSHVEPDPDPSPPAPGAPARRGRPRVADPARRRDSIVASAAAAFVELGFDGTTTRIVAERAGVSKRAIYELFTGKTGLFAAVVLAKRHLLLDLPRPPGERLPPLQALERIFRLDMDHQRDREREALLTLILRESAQVPELSDVLYDQRILRGREDLIDWLEGAQRDGVLPVADAPLLAGLLMDVVFGALLPRRRESGDAQRDRRKDDIRKRLAIILRGLDSQTQGRDAAVAERPRASAVSPEAPARSPRRSSR